MLDPVCYLNLSITLTVTGISSPHWQQKIGGRYFFMPLPGRRDVWQGENREEKEGLRLRKKKIRNKKEIDRRLN